MQTTNYSSICALIKWKFELHLPCIEEDELHVQLGPEHEHILVQFDFRDGG